MRAYVLRRLLWMIPTFLGITLLSYGLMRAAPGDPVKSTLLAGAGDTSTGVRQAGESEAAKAFRRRFHLDQAWYVGYWRWLVGYDPECPWYRSYWHSLTGTGDETPGASKGVLRGDFGTSIVYSMGTPVWDVLKGPMWVTIKLNFWVLLVIYTVALPFGLYSAARKGGWAERSLSMFFFVLYSLPSYWTGLLLIIAVGLYLPGGWPTRGLTGETPPDAGYWALLWDTAKHYVLPVFCLSYTGFASLSRYTRSGVLEVIRQDFVRTARAKGLPESQVLTRHVLRNSLITLITLFAGLLPGLLGGSVIIEFLFNIPGLGKLGLDVLASRDYPVLMTDFGLGALLVMLGILFSDLLYAVADPRIAYS